MMQLTSCVLLRPALPEVGILSGYSFSCLSALHDHATFVLRKGQHHCQNQISRQRVLHQPHIQDVHPNTPVKKLSDRRNTIYSRPGEAIQFGDNQSVSFLQLLKKHRKSGSFHGLPAEGLCDDLLTAIGLQCLGLILQRVAVLALTSGGHSGVAVGLSLRACGTIGAITAGKVIEVVGTTFGEEVWHEIERLVEQVKADKYLF